MTRDTFEAREVRLSHKLQLSSAYSLLHSLYLKREREQASDARAYELEGFYEQAGVATLVGKLTSKASAEATYERELVKGLKAKVTLNFSPAYSDALLTKAYLQYLSLIHI